MMNADTEKGQNGTESHDNFSEQVPNVSMLKILSKTPPEMQLRGSFMRSPLQMLLKSQTFMAMGTMAIIVTKPLVLEVKHKTPKLSNLMLASSKTTGLWINLLGWNSLPLLLVILSLGVMK